MNMAKVNAALSTPRKVVYDVGFSEPLDDGLIESLPWPETVPTLCLLFPQATDVGNEVQVQHISGKYLVSLMLMADKAAVLDHKAAGTGNIVLERIQSKDDLVDFYVDNQKEHFYKQWSDYISMEHLAGTRKFAEQFVTPDLSAFFVKDGVRVGFATLVRWKDLSGAPADLISWVWFDQRLSKADRSEAHSRMVHWLKDTAQSDMCCAVDSFNIRSQKFFKKMGFKVTCVIVTRNSPA